MAVPASAEYLPCAHPVRALSVQVAEPMTVLFQPEGQFLQKELDDAPIFSENDPTEQPLQTNVVAPILEE